MRVLRILGRISDETVSKHRECKSPPDTDIDHFYFVDFTGFTFKLGEHMCAVYRPNGKLLIAADIELAYITMGWGDSQNEILKGIYYGCGFRFSDKSSEVINGFLSTSNVRDFIPNRYLYFLDNQAPVPMTVPLDLLGYISV